MTGALRVKLSGHVGVSLIAWRWKTHRSIQFGALSFYFDVKDTIIAIGFENIDEWLFLVIKAIKMIKIHKDFLGNNHTKTSEAI